MHNARSELPRNLERRSSQNLPSETVWKIAEGIWSALLWRQEAADRDSFDPSWPLSQPRFGTHCEVPNSFSKQAGTNSKEKGGRHDIRPSPACRYPARGGCCSRLLP